MVNMAFIDKYFTEDKTTYSAYGITAYVFNDALSAQFINDCLVPFREAYIKEEKLVQIVNDFNTTRQQEIQERLPKSTAVVAGDFEEILTYYLATQVWQTDVNVCPMKWRLKDKKDAASHYSDVILFKLGENGPLIDDAMYSFEAKVRSTGPAGNYKVESGYKSGKPECVFIDAVMDAEKDRVSRAAETINYLLVRYKDLGLKEEYDKIFRFANPYCTVSYHKEHSAVAIIDSAYTAQQFSKLPPDLFANFPEIRVLFVPIKDLKLLYERVYAQLSNT